MKIDELMRETTIKLDQAAKGKVAAGTVASTEVAALVADIMPDSDFFFPDLLQSFAKLLSRRQELMELLPQAAQSRLNDTAGSPQTVLPRSPENPASAGGQTINTPFPQGISGLARDSRMMTDTLRQMISELEFVERCLIWRVFTNKCESSRLKLPDSGKIARVCLLCLAQPE